MLEDHKQLRKLQLEQYKILQSVNDLCSKYGIEYYLLYGTLLGAVRHSKFIPWDYDIDIAMERTQFNRFKSVVQELPDWLEVWDMRRRRRRLPPGAGFISAECRVRWPD